MRMKSPTVTITTAITERPLHGADEDLLRHHAEDECDREREEEGLPVRETPEHELVGDVHHRHRHLALREVDHLGRAIDEDEREGEAPEHDAGRNSGHGQLREDRASERADGEEDARRDEKQQHGARREASLRQGKLAGELDHQCSPWWRF